MVTYVFDRRNQLCGRLSRSIRESCLVTDPLEVFLPRYGPLRSVFASSSEVLLWTGNGFVVPHWGGLCRGRSFNDNMVKNPLNECLQSMGAYSHDQSLSKSK